MMTQKTDKKREQIQMFCMDDMVPQDHLTDVWKSQNGNGGRAYICLPES